MLFELLTGSVPYRRDTDVAVMWAHMNEPPPQPHRSCAATCRAPWTTVIAAGMAKHSRRALSPAASALVEDFASRPGGASAQRSPHPPPQPVTAATAAPIDRSSARTAAGTEPPAPARQTPAHSPGHPTPLQPKPPRQRPVMAIALILAALLLAGGASAAALIATQDKDEPAPERIVNVWQRAARGPAVGPRGAERPLP